MQPGYIYLPFQKRVSDFIHRNDPRKAADDDKKAKPVICAGYHGST